MNTGAVNFYCNSLKSEYFLYNILLNNSSKASRYDTVTKERKTHQDATILKIQRFDYLAICLHSISSIIYPRHNHKRWNPFIGKDQSGAQVIAPFADPAWAGYWLAAPREMRKGQKLYLEMLNMKFPALFALPGKANFGVHRGHRLLSLFRGDHISSNRRYSGEPRGLVSGRRSRQTTWTMTRCSAPGRITRRRLRLPFLI